MTSPSAFTERSVEESRNRLYRPFEMKPDPSRAFNQARLRRARRVVAPVGAAAARSDSALRLDRQRRASVRHRELLLPPRRAAVTLFAARLGHVGDDAAPGTVVPHTSLLLNSQHEPRR